MISRGGGGVNIALWRSNGANPGTNYIIGFTYGVIGVVGSRERFKEVPPSILGEDHEFHVWRIIFDAGDSTMTFLRDGVEVARFTQVRGNALSFATEGRLTLQAVPLSITPTGGDLDLYIDYIAFKGEDPPELWNKALLYPNPFSTELRFPYFLEGKGEVSVVIYDEGGYKVFVKEDRVEDGGYHEMLWDGRDDNGREVPAELYRCLLIIKYDDGTISRIEGTAAKGR